MSMEDQDQRLTDLIGEALVPRGFRPQSDDEIESLLDAVGGEPLSEGEIERILAKVRGEIPIGERNPSSTELIEGVFTESEQELVALHRTQGQELPPEIQKRLEELRKKAKEEQKEKENAQEE